MNSRSTIVFLWLILCSATCPSFGQLPQIETTQATITYLCWNDVLEAEYNGYEGEVPMEIPMQVRSVPYEYEGPRQFLLTEPAQKNAKNAPEPPPIASISLPPDADRVLVILIPQSGNLPYRAISINDSFNIFPRQSLRILNMTSYPLTGKLGDSVFEVAPKGEAVTRPEETKGPKHLVPFRMVRYYESEDAWRPLRSTIFQMYPDVRILALILDDPNQANLRFVLLRDKTPDEESASDENEDPPTL